MSGKGFKLAALLIVIGLLTSACAAGFNAATNKQRVSGNGRSADVDAIQVRNAIIVKDAKTSGKAVLVATIINTAEDADSLAGLEIETDAGKSVPYEIALGPQEPVQFGLPKQNILPIELNDEVAAGTFVRVQLDFQNNAPVPMSLLVENNDGMYSDIIFSDLGGEHIPFR